ncbi:MAG TPA: hypothetical protein VF988_08745 [Verrucomicrobiae bacterium]
MKFMRLSRVFFLPVLALALAGCQTHKEVRPLRNGYEEVWHPYHTLLDEPQPPRISFQHRGAGDKVTQIWPSLCGSGEVFHGDMALFAGDRGEAAEHVTRPRLFAVTPGELPRDLTDEVLWRWAKANGKDFGVALSRFTAIAPQEKNGGLNLQLDFISEVQLLRPERDWPDRSELWLSWNQVDEIVRAVKTKGVHEKDPRWHTPYIGERF